MSRITIAEALKKLMSDPAQTKKDISHFMHVWGYAKVIGELECLDPATQYILEMAAILHDIACPLCRQKYGNTIAKYQEAEGMILTQAFLADCGLSEEMLKRVVYLVGHHHTYSNVIGIDYQILLEADYITNAVESAYSVQAVLAAKESLFRTSSGKELLCSVFAV